MNRRSSLKYLGLTAFSGVLLEACKPSDKKRAIEAKAAGDDKITIDRTPEEAALEKKLLSETFFTPHELATIAVLSDIIIPRDEVSGSATDAKVPDFIEFIVKDRPEHQLPMRGGLRWLDMQMLRQHGRPFKDCSSQQQIQMVDAIAYPDKAEPQMAQGVAFFNRMRSLTASGFYTSEIGLKDIGFAGNKPNQWNGVPADVLQHHNVAYTEKEIKECIQYS